MEIQKNNHRDAGNFSSSQESILKNFESFPPLLPELSLFFFAKSTSEIIFREQKHIPPFLIQDEPWLADFENTNRRTPRSL